MSFSGKFTSLGLNVQSQLMNNQGLTISPTVQAYQGSWINGAYTAGSVTNTTVLDRITRALPNFLNNCVPAKLSVANWRTLLKIGSTTIPALGNSSPATFVPTYAGYGSWEYKNVDSYGNITGSGVLSKVADIYPPKNYGKEKTYSYVFQEHNDYAWITGWPGKNSWQKSSDDFSAAYYPQVADTGLIDYDSYFSQGFIATVARQAYYEFWYNYQTRRSNQYQEFLNMLTQCYQFKQSSNKMIASLVNTKTFIKGNYSNINDLTTSDVAGVSLSLKEFGNDLIRLGKSLDLSNIHVFGLPSKFLLNLQENGALTDGLKFALLLTELTITDVSNLLLPEYTPSLAQEKKIYDAMLMIQGQDLVDICITMNVATVGLTSLADLINPLKMFPSSYQSLTIPTYSTQTLSSKNYTLIYTGANVNSHIQNWGTYLAGILPDDLALACGAFMMSMNQIKNIRQMECEKLAQVVANLELTNKDLPLINSEDATPGQVSLATQGLEQLSFGTGNGGIYRYSDFLGAMSGYPYVDYYKQVVSLMSHLSTTNLENLYIKLYQKSLGNDWALPSEGTSTNAYKLFKATTAAVAGANTVSVNSDATTVISVGNIITFSTSDSVNTPIANSYTVTGVTATSVTFTPALASSVASSSFIFKYETDYNTSVPNLVTAANSVIAGILSTDPVTSNQLNYYWRQIGNQLATEQRAIVLAVKQSSSVYTGVDMSAIENFVRAVPDYSLETEYCQIAPILDEISDLTVVGGQSLVAMMREARNAQRLINTGGELDNDVPDSLSQAASAVATVVGGKVDSIEITSNGSGYGIGCDCCTPNVVVYPQGGVFGGSGAGATATAIMDENGSVKEIVVTNGGNGYSDTNPPQIYIDTPPNPSRIGSAIVVGSFAGSPYTGEYPVPNNLVSSDNSSYTANEAASIVKAC